MPNYLFLATDGGTFCAKRLVLFVLLFIVISCEKKRITLQLVTITVKRLIVTQFTVYTKPISP